MRTCSIFCLLIVLVSVTASDLCLAKKRTRLYPKGCSPNAAIFESNYVLLGTNPSDEQYRVFVFRNISHHSVQLGQAREQNALGAHFDSVIEPNKLSALLIERNDFKLVCHDPDSSGSWEIPCNEVIRACELRVSPVMESAQGQYWITSNRGSQRSLFGDLRGHGIFP